MSNVHVGGSVVITDDATDEKAVKNLDKETAVEEAKDVLVPELGAVPDVKVPATADDVSAEEGEFKATTEKKRSKKS